MLAAFKTVTAAFFFEAKTYGESRGITFVGDDDAEERLSYLRVLDRAIVAAARLQAEGIRRGDRILVVVPTHASFLDAFFGAMLLGAIPCPLSPPMGFGAIEEFRQRAAELARSVEARAVVTIGLLASVLDGALPPGCRLLDVEVLREGDVASVALPETRPEETAFIQFSSGSTALSKGVALSHEAIIANVYQIGWQIDLKAGDVGVSWLPLYHDMGLIGTLLTSIYWNIDSVFLSPFHFLERPATWLRTISKHRGTLSAGPNFSYVYTAKRAREKDLEGVDLSSWRVTCCGAEPIDRSALETFLARFRRYGLRDTVFAPCYGLAEATLAVTFHPHGSPFVVDGVSRARLAEGEAAPAEAGDPDRVEFVSCGRPLPEMRVRVVDEQGAEAGERRVGEILVAGPTLFSGYFQRPDATKEALIDGWLRTGDLGYVASGNLYITGRKKDLIIIRGKNFYPHEFEWAAEEVEGVRRGNVVAYSHHDERAGTERVTLVAETGIEDQGGREELRHRVVAHVAKKVGVRVDRVELVEKGTIPKTSSGKLQRARCKAESLARLAAEGRPGG